VSSKKTTYTWLFILTLGPVPAQDQAMHRLLVALSESLQIKQRIGANEQVDVYLRDCLDS